MTWQRVNQKLPIDLTFTSRTPKFAKRNIGIKTLKIVNKVQVEQATEYLQQGIAISTPWAKPSSYANLDYTHECNKAANETQPLRRIHRLTQSEDDWDRYRQARNRKKRTMAAAPRMKRCHHVEEVMTNDVAGLWLLEAEIESITEGRCQQGKQARTESGGVSTAVIPEPPLADQYRQHLVIADPLVTPELIEIFSVLNLEENRVGFVNPKSGVQPQNSPLIANDSGTEVTIEKRAIVKAYGNLKALQELAGSAWGSLMTGMRKYIRDW
ncbi:hypothetical protein V8E54_000344 [Elaphomyces granulatus]